MQGSPKQQSKKSFRSSSSNLERGNVNRLSQQQSHQTNCEASSIPQSYIESSKEKFWKEGARLDKEFDVSIRQIMSYLPRFNKHEKIRIEQWIKKLNQATSNLVWKQNRNLYVRVLSDMAGRSSVYEPFSHVPQDGPLPRLSKYDLVIETIQI